MTTLLEVFGDYDYLVRESLLLVLVALGIYLLLSAGLFAVPQLGFMAVGGYTAAILSTELELHWALTLGAALTAGSAVGLALGIALVRLDGIYLALASIGFNEIVRVTARNLDVTGGAVGIAGVERSTTDVHILATIATVLTVLALVRRSRVGRAIDGMREDSLMASHQGINLRRYRIVLFAAAGAISASGGALLVHLTGFIEPEHFSFPVLVELLASTVLGGMTSVVGPFLGGIVVFGLPAVSTGLAQYRDLVNGVVIVVIIAVVPGGLAGAIGRSGRLIRSSLMSTRSKGDVTHPAAEPADTEGEVRRLVRVTAPTQQLLVSAMGLSRAFGGVQALRDVSLQMFSGEIFGLIGPNGSGKTTFINVLSGVYVPDHGDILLEGASLRSTFGRPDKVRRRGIARTFQGIRLVHGRSVRDNVLLGAHVVGRAPRFVPSRSPGRSPVELDETVDLLISELGLRALADRDVGSLPYGPQRRVEIARALVAQPRLLLLDEPTAGMSPGERTEIFDLIGEVRHRGVTVVVVEHDIASIARVCDRVAVLNFGEVIAVDTPEAVLAKEVVVDAYLGRSVTR